MLRSRPRRRHRSQGTVAGPRWCSRARPSRRPASTRSANFMGPPFDVPTVRPHAPPYQGLGQDRVTRRDLRQPARGARSTDRHPDLRRSRPGDLGRRQRRRWWQRGSRTPSALPSAAGQSEGAERVPPPGGAAARLHCPLSGECAVEAMVPVGWLEGLSSCVNWAAGRRRGPDRSSPTRPRPTSSAASLDRAVRDVRPSSGAGSRPSCTMRRPVTNSGSMRTKLHRSPSADGVRPAPIASATTNRSRTTCARPTTSTLQPSRCSRHRSGPPRTRRRHRPPRRGASSPTTRGTRSSRRRRGSPPEGSAAGHRR